MSVTNAESVQMVRLFPMIRDQESKHKTVWLVLKVSVRSEVH